MHENEILVVLLASCVLAFVIIYRRQLSILPAHRTLFAAFACAWLAWVSTALEHLFLPTFFNVLEHLGYAANGLLLLTWCWLGMRNGHSVEDD